MLRRQDSAAAETGPRDGTTSGGAHAHSAGDISPGRRQSAVAEAERRQQRETESTRTFASAYKRFERLGSGTFGAVYRCTRRIDHTVFAVKEISLAGLRRQDVAALRREVTLQRKVGQHRNIVELVEVFEEGPFFISFVYSSPFLLFAHLFFVYSPPHRVRGRQRASRRDGVRRCLRRLPAASACVAGYLPSVAAPSSCRSHLDSAARRGFAC
jgi:serine/threonine protein kinase